MIMKIWKTVFTNIEDKYIMSADASALIKAQREIALGFDNVAQAAGRVPGKVSEVSTSIDKLGNVTTAVTSKLEDGTKVTQTFAQNQDIISTKVKQVTRDLEGQAAALNNVASAQGRVVSNAQRIVQSITANLGTGTQGAFAQAKASPDEIDAFQKAKIRLREVLAQQDITLARGKQMWSQLNTGALTYANSAEIRVADAMRRLQIAASQLGATQRQAALDAGYGLVRLQQQYIQLAATVQSSRAIIQRQSLLPSTNVLSLGAGGGGNIPPRFPPFGSADYFKGNIVDVGGYTNAMKKATSETERFFLSWESVKRLVAIQLMHQAISQLTQAIRLGTQQAMEFQMRISEIRTISQDTALSFGEWAKGIRKVSDAFGMPILDTAEAAYQAISNQVVKGAETFDFMSSASKLAVTSVGKVSDAVNALSSVINAYGLTAKDAETISAQIFTSINLGRFRLKDMADSLGNITIIAKEVGVSFIELMSGMNAMTVQGFTWSQAMTQMRGLMSQMIKPGEDMKRFFTAIGATSGEAAIEMYGFIGVIDKLREFTDGSSTAIAEEVRNIRGLLAALSLGGQAHDAYTQSLERLKNSQQEYDKAFQIGMESDAKKVQVEMNKVKNYFLTDMGENFLKKLAEISVAMGGFDNAIKNLMTALKILADLGMVYLASKVRVLVSALAIGPLRDYMITMTYLTSRVTAFGFAAQTAANQVKLLLGAFTAVGLAAQIALDLGTRYYEKEAENQQKLFDQWQQLFKERQTILSEATRKEAGIIQEGITKASQAILVQSSSLLAKMQGQIKSISDDAIGINKITDEVISATLSVIKDKITETKKLINDLESDIKQLETMVLDVNKTANKTASNATKADLTGDPAAQLEAKKVEFAALVNELKRSTTTDEIKKIYSELFTNINQQADIQRSVARTNIINAHDRETIERQLRLEMTSYGEKMLNYVERERILKRKARTEDRKDKLEALEHDKDALTDQHNERIKNLRKELENHKDVIVKGSDLVKTTETTRQAILRKINERQLKDQEELTNQSIEKYYLEARVDRLNEIKQSLDAFNIKRILENTNPKDVQRWFDQRTKAFTDAIEFINLEMERLSPVEKEKLKAVIEEFKAETEAVYNKINVIPGLKIDEAQVKQDLIRAKQLIDRLVLEQAKSNITRASIEGSIQQGISRALVENRSVRLENVPYGPAQRLGNIESVYGKNMVEFVKFVQANIGTKPQLLNKLPERLQEDILRLAGLSKESYNLLLKISTIQSEANKSLTEAQQQLVQLNLRLGLEGEAVKGLQTSTKALDTSVQGVTNVMTTLINNVEALVNRVRSIPTPTIPEPYLPTKPNKFSIPVEGQALGGMMGSDSIHAMLSPGEFVVNAASSRRFYSQLVAMNSVGRFADGGMVGNTTNVGDINVSMRSSGNETIDVVHLGRLLQREIKRGTISLS